MTIETWCLFVLVSACVLASPGPVAALAASSALTHGRAAWVVIPGAGLGDLAALSTSLSGVGALLVGAPDVAAALKAAGASVLIWLGVRMIVTGKRTRSAPAMLLPRSRQALFWTAFGLTAFHPAGLVFYVSYVPQFVDSSRTIWLQLALMQATFLVLGLMTTAFWVYAGARAGAAFGSSRRLDWIGGAFLLLLGTWVFVSLLF